MWKYLNSIPSCSIQIETIPGFWVSDLREESSGRDFKSCSLNCLASLRQEAAKSFSTYFLNLKGSFHVNWAAD